MEPRNSFGNAPPGWVKERRNVEGIEWKSCQVYLTVFNVGWETSIMCRL